MTAPPEMRMPLSTFDPYLNLASSYISPASIVASDSSFFWAPMPPHQETNVRPQRETSRSLSAASNAEAPNNGGFMFITAGTPADFRSKKNMTVVRKKAMAAYLEGDEKSNKKSRSRFSSVDSESKGSNRSKRSVGSQDATDLSTIPTTVSQAGESVGRTKKSSPVQSSHTPSSHEQDTASVDGPIVRAQQPHDFVLPAAPIFLPCRKGIPLPYDNHTPPPFVSIGKSLDPFQTMFQSSHPGVSVEELKFYCSRYFGTRALGKYWIPTALSHPHTFLGTLCLATAYHDVIHERQLESVQTIALRQEVIHLVGRNMLDPEARVADHNIMAIIQLIISEVIGREESGLRWHEDGIESMIKQRGGLDKLGVDGCLASSISWVSLATAVLREERPRSMYAEYCAANSTKQYKPTAIIPESPICCPRSALKTITKSTKCTPKARALLEDIKSMTDSMLHEARSTRRNSQTLLDLYNKIRSPIQYPPVEEIRRGGKLLTQHDHKYEAIRIASIIQATAIFRRIPLSAALVEVADSQAPPVPPTFYHVPIAAVSSDSLVSPYDTYQNPSAIDTSTSPTFSTYPISPAVPQSYFPTSEPRSSISSFNTPRPSFSSTTSAARPSISSTHSASSDHIYFPPPPAPTPNNATSLLMDLRTSIEKSNISACWSDMAGVLLWIGLVVGAATNKSDSKIHKKYFSALTMRAGVLLCFEHPEAINSTMVRMCEVVEALSGQESPKPSNDEGKGKKMKT